MTKEQKKVKFEKKRKNQYKNSGVVYTDGSADAIPKGAAGVRKGAAGVRKGAAAVLFSLGKKYEVCKKVTEQCPTGWSESLIAEIHGITMALELIKYYLKVHSDVHKFTIFCDCASALNEVEIKDLKLKSIKKIWSLINDLQAVGVELIFTYCPAHCNIKGNEMADNLARDARYKQSDLNETISELKFERDYDVRFH